MQPSFTPTVQLQALTVVTLAKMCLQNEEMAKKVVPAFGRLLSTTSDAALKNNIMYALSDMCVRYASLVDPLLPQMTACLRDPGNFLKIFFLNYCNVFFRKIKIKSRNRCNFHEFFKKFAV